MSDWDSLPYHSGFGAHITSEAIAGAVPPIQNNPQRCAMGLYSEQLSGTAFTCPRSSNQFAWLFRILPSAKHTKFQPYEGNPLLVGRFDADAPATPNQCRWDPLVRPGVDVDFVDGIVTVAGAGDPCSKTGIAVHQYLANRSMARRAFNNADGDLLLVPQEGALHITTEFGRMCVRPGEIAVIQRNVRFSVALPPGCDFIRGATLHSSRRAFLLTYLAGYICETFTGHFQLPDLGPIGANGLAAARHFLVPHAAFEEVDAAHVIVHKFGGALWMCEQDHSPFDVVGWHGNYAPYKYDLAAFCVVNTVSFDHLDPSIFTVLTCPTLEPGVAAVDFVIFPPRWMVAENTFRPPYYHRNCMTEYMGLIRGSYDAKKGGFVPGGSSLHSCGTPHGPDGKVFDAASHAELKPVKVPGTDLAFM